MTSMWVQVSEHFLVAKRSTTVEEEKISMSVRLTVYMFKPSHADVKFRFVQRGVDATPTNEHDQWIKLLGVEDDLSVGRWAVCGYKHLKHCLLWTRDRLRIGWFGTLDEGDACR